MKNVGNLIYQEKQTNTNQEKQNNTNQEKQTNKNQEKQTNTNQEQQTNTNQEKQKNTNQEKQTNTNQEKQTNRNQEIQTNTNQKQQTNTNQEKHKNTNQEKPKNTNQNTDESKNHNKDKKKDKNKMKDKNKEKNEDKNVILKKGLSSDLSHEQKKSEAKWGSPKKLEFSKLKNTDQVVKVLKSLEISQKDFLGSGCTATVFRKNDQAVKVCSRNISYFSNYKGNPQSFKTHINSLSNIFLPINEILYEDNNFFIYTQDLCTPLEKKTVNKKITAEFFQLFQLMVQHNCLVSGLSPRNVCFYHGQLFIYDYHGLHPFKTLQSARLARNLVKYMTLTFCPHKFHDHKVIMAKFNQKSINQLTQLPSTFIDLLKIMLNDKICKEKIIHSIEKCIQQLRENSPGK